ncbi:MAG: ELM1/GtrOC1 family putative glycosyltransferase [Candidatus Omnitrophota bacterium]|jgi:KDO2-lipid IV(A) lauroyltransferase
MKKDFIIDFLGYTIVKSLGIFLRFIPLRFALWCGRRAGDIVYHANLKRRMIAYANLKAAFPEKSPAELKKINRKHFENLGMNAVELLKLPFMREDYLGEHVKLKNPETIESGLEKGKGVIILTAHFGNWEIASLAASLRGYTMSVFAREQKYERLNNLLNQFRQSTGCRVITKGFSIKDIIRTLNNNGIVAMLSDQDAGANGVFVDFFNRPASMAQGITAFGSKTGARILPSFIRREGPDRHVAWTEGPFELVNTGDKERDTKENLQRMARILEEHVRKYPGQWLWAHKRWKSTPERSVLVLADGKAGHFNQAMAVAETVEKALGLRLKARGIEEKPVVKIHTAEVRFKNNFTKILLNLASVFASGRCQGSMRCLELCLTKESFDSLKGQYADIVVSCGASTTAANIFLKYENNAKNVVIMKPGLGRTKKIDLIILPRHDTVSDSVSRRRRLTESVLVTEGAPNRALPAKGSGRGIGLLIGGDAKDFKLKRQDVEKVIEGAIKISAENNLDIFVSTSRRTPPAIESLLKERLNGNERCKLLIIANEKNAEGAVADIFDSSGVIITSPESMSMISEAASSGRHVIVFRAGEKKSKYNRMVSNLAEQGYIKISEPDGMYNKIKEILETMPEIKRLNDSEKIIERLKSII